MTFLLFHITEYLSLDTALWVLLASAALIGLS